MEFECFHSDPNDFCYYGGHARIIWERVSNMLRMSSTYTCGVEFFPILTQHYSILVWTNVMWNAFTFLGLHPIIESINMLTVVPVFLFRTLYVDGFLMGDGVVCINYAFGISDC